MSTHRSGPASDAPWCRAFTFLLALPLVAASLPAAEPLQTFMLEEHLGRRWQDELVHFAFDVPGTSTELTLADPQGTPVVCQLVGVKVDAERKRVSGMVWTTVTLEPRAKKTLCLVPGKSPAAPAATAAAEPGFVVLSNERMAIHVPDWSGRATSPTDLTRLPAPIDAVRLPGGAWLGSGQWLNRGAALVVREAKTEVLERGPVRARVRQSLVLDSGQSYEAIVELGLAQEAAAITEHSTIAAPQAGFRFSLVPGLNADRILWHNQWRETPHAKSFTLTNTTADFQTETVLCKLRPWSFWWIGDLTMWAGFYRDGGEALVGVLALRPSQWLPSGWGGFDRTELPVTVGPGPRLDVTFPLVAVGPNDPSRIPAGPFHRQWALTVGRTKDHVPEAAASPQPASPPTLKLRRQLVQLSEFPLDEVKDYGFDFRGTPPRGGHPYLILTRADVERVRRQARTVPAFREVAAAARKYVIDATHSARTLETEGAVAFYKKNYIGNYLVEKLPEAYLTADDPVYGRMLAAAVVGVARDNLDTFLDAPHRPALGAYGPWISEVWMRLLLNYDLIAGSGVLSAEDDAFVRKTLVFGAHMLAHPDYWNTDRGLCSANPNMTNSILLPRGMVALLLAGHPRSGAWLEAAEAELRQELKTWISPGGAWIENPGYQSASLDSLFLLAQAIRNVQGRDYFADRQFRDTLEYYGFMTGGRGSSTSMSGARSRRSSMESVS